MVDGAWLDPISHTPGNEYKPRLDLVARLYVSRKIDKIILMAGKATRGVDMRHCDAGAKYLQEKGIPSDAILLEPDGAGVPVGGSKDTAGEFVINGACYQKLLTNKKIKIILISSDYHEDRIREIAGTVLGKDPENFCFRGIPRRVHGNYKRRPIHERKSLASFRKTFRGLRPGDIHQATKILQAKHPLYKK